MSVHVVHYTHMDLDWFKSRKKELGLTDADIAVAISRDRSIANKLLSGKLPFDLKYVDGLASAFRVSKAEILFRAGVGDEPGRPNEPAPASGDQLPTVGIQNIDQPWGLGAAYTDTAVQVEVLQFPKVWMDAISSTSPGLLTWARARGDSMGPTIDDGDLILIDRTNTRKVDEQDALWAFTVGDTASIKRLRVKGDRYVILSDNPNVPPDEEPIDFVNLVGRVVFVGKRK